MPPLPASPSQRAPYACAWHLPGAGRVCLAADLQRWQPARCSLMFAVQHPQPHFQSPCVEFAAPSSSFCSPLQRWCWLSRLPCIAWAWTALTAFHQNPRSSFPGNSKDLSGNRRAVTGHRISARCILIRSHSIPCQHRRTHIPRPDDCMASRIRLSGQAPAP